jgi:hypothetical protein
VCQGATVAGASEPEVKGLFVSAWHQAGGDGLGSWDLELNSRGQLVVRVVRAGQQEHRLGISATTIGELVQTIQREKALELSKEVGEGAAIDGEFRVMTIALNGRRKTVTLFDRPGEDPEEFRRALRVWVAIRGLFDLPGAADSRGYDRRFLE